MLNFFQRTSRGKEELRRASDGSGEHGTPTTQPAAGDSDTRGALPGPEPSHVDTSAAHVASVVVPPQPEARNITLHPDLASIVPAPTSGDTPAGPPNSDPSHADLCVPRLPTATVSPTPAANDGQLSNLAPTAPTTPQIKQSFKDTSWAGLETLLQELNESADAFGPLKSAVGGLVRCIEIYESQASTRKGYDKLRTELNDLCQDISGYIRRATTPSMTPCIASLARGIEVETGLVLKRGQRKTFERYVEAIGDADEILKCYRRIRMHLERLALNANSDVWKIVDEQAMRNRLGHLPYSSAANYRSTESIHLGRHGCTSNTRVDVLEQLLGWAEDIHSQKIYWLNGVAGTGKTTIAYSLCEHIESAGKLAASFFCSRQLPECCDVGRILPSIAYQLSLFSGPFRYAISKVLESDPRAYDKSPGEQFESLIAAPLREIGHTLPSDLVIVINALDECDSTNGMNLMLPAILAHLPDLPVKVFITSRPDPNILDQMRGEQAQRVRSELRLHELDHSIVQSDIRMYLTTELEKLKLNPTVIDQLVERSGVVLIYAATVVRYLKHENFARGTQRLKQVLATTAVHDQEPDALYTSILRAALDDNALENSEREEMTRVLRTVVCAQEPLSVNDIAALLGLDDVDVRIALRPPLSVLRISDSSGIVTTIHESFPGYLLDKERSKRFYCDPKRHNAWLASACFRLIKTPPPFNICNLESSYLLDRDVPGLSERVRQHIPQYLFYACRYWEAHVEVAEAPEELLEIMNLKQGIRSGVDILSRLHTLLQYVKCSSEAQELARDAWNFVKDFASGEARLLTPHIYISALAMWPEHSPISRHYSRTISGLTQVSRTGGESASLAAPKSLGEVASLAYSPDGARLVSSSADKAIRIWDAHTGRMQIGPLLQGHTDSANLIAHSPDGAHITSSSDKTIPIWGAHTGHTHSVRSATFSPNGSLIVSSCADKTIRIWDADTGVMISNPLQGHTHLVWSVAFSPDGARIASGSADNTIRIWDGYTGEMIGQPLQGHTGWVWSVAYSPDGARIASGSDDKSIRIWDAYTGQMLGQPLQGHTDSVWSVAYSPDAARIVSGSHDRTLRVWDTHTGQMIGQPLRGHTHLVWSVAFSPDGALIISGSEDNTIRIWNARTGQVVGQPLQGHTASVRSVAYSPDGARIVSGSSDNTIRIWDAQTSMMLGQPPEGHHHSTNSVTRWTLSGDGWVMAPQDKRLVWVPPHLRDTLLHPQNTLIISTRGSVTLDFSRAKFGEEWYQCYHP